MASNGITFIAAYFCECFKNLNTHTRARARNVVSEAHFVVFFRKANSLLTIHSVLFQASTIEDSVVRNAPLRRLESGSQCFEGICGLFLQGSMRNDGCWTPDDEVSTFFRRLGNSLLATQSIIPKTGFLQFPLRTVHNFSFRNTILPWCFAATLMYSHVFCLPVISDPPHCLVCDSCVVLVELRT
jgi:hypothetical protein